MSDRPQHEGFTPGPWEPTNDYAPGVMTPWDVIAPGPCITVATDLTESNARLIADAPRLLAENAALRERQERLVEALRFVRRTFVPNHEAITRIDAALQEPTT